MTQREALLGIAIGKKGVGKTYATLQTIQEYLRPKRSGITARKVLILDVNNEFIDVRKDANPNFEHVKAIRLEDVPKFTYSPKIEARRVSVLKPEGGKMNTKELQQALHYILEHYQNGLLLIEDINKFVSDSLPSDLIGTIISQRHVSVDIITHFQSVGKCANPKLWANCNWLRFHKCEDTVERHKNKFAGNTEHLKILEKMVDIEYYRGNTRFHAYLMKDTGKIRGAFSKLTFRKAIEEYLQDNYSIVEKEIRKKDLYTGKLVHKNQKSAVEGIIKYYMNEYYGNAK